MADLSAAGLEALVNGYYQNMNVSAQDLSDMYREAAETAKANAGAAYSTYQQGLQNQRNISAEQYADVARRAELLKGTNTANYDVNAYEGGTAQTIRNNALQNNLNTINAAEANESEQLRLAENVGAQNNKANIANLESSYLQAYRSGQQSENQQGAQRELNAFNSLLTAKGYYNNQKNAEDTLEAQKQADNYNNAMTELKTFGVVMTKASADALGVPIGTKKSSLTYTSGSGGGSTKVVNFSEGTYGNGQTVRTTAKYANDNDYNDALSAAVATGSAEKVRQVLQDGVWDGKLTTKQAQTAYNTYKNR